MSRSDSGISTAGMTRFGLGCAASAPASPGDESAFPPSVSLTSPSFFSTTTVSEELSPLDSALLGFPVLATGQAEQSRYE